jgi:hypothetical protein
MATSAREYHTQQVHYLRKTIDLSTGGVAVGSAITIGVIPANAQVVVGGGIVVVTGFNGTTPTIDIGYAADSAGAADPNAYASALSLATAAGLVALDELAAATAAARSVDTTVTATVSGTGTTTGVVNVFLSYIPNR